MPKVTFSVAVPAARDELPPMDVAAFVGFAASGPIDVPVAVYDQVRFEEIFGDDLLLARSESGEPVYGHLAATVRAFFRNGGRKCYVVRVAADDARSNGFLVPGLMALSQGSEGAVGRFSSLLWARSEGAWSDELRVGAKLRQEPYVTRGADEMGGAFRLALQGVGTPLPRAGDLIRVDLERPVSDGAFKRSTRLYLFPTQVIELEHGAGPVLESVEARVSGTEHWFEVIASAGTETGPTSARARLLPSWTSGQGEPAASTGAGEHPARWFLPDEAGALHRIVLPFEAGAGPGSLLEIFDTEASGGEVGEPFLAGVTEVRSPTQEELEAVCGLGGDRWLTALAREVLAPLARGEGRSRFLLAPPEALRADRLTFDLWTKDGRGDTAELRGLGFSPLSPRYAGYLPSDRARYGAGRSHAPMADGSQPGSALWNEVDHPRFPLASLPAEMEARGGFANASPAYFLPIGMERGRRIEATSGRRVSEVALGSERSAEAAERNGLYRFSAELFLDPDLAASPAETLTDAAFHKQYVQGRPLRKLHATMALSDVTVLSVPDAVHAPWEEEPPSPAPVLGVPRLDFLDASGAQAVARWSSVDPVEGGPIQYLLEESTDPQFTTVVRRFRSNDAARTFELDVACPLVRYYRVRAEERGLVGPWSNTQVARLPRLEFEECELVLPPRPVPAAPVLDAPALMPDGRCRLSWSPVALPWAPEGGGGLGDASDAAQTAGEVEYVVSQSESPDFRDALTVYRGGATEAYVFLQGDGAGGALYFRVRAQILGTSGPWSNSAILIRPAARAGRLVALAIADGLEAEKVHAAMLNACAARGDMTCVISTPAGYDAARAAAYIARLTGRFGAGRDRLLGYGALYYPWTWVAHAGRGERLIPPDGCAAGVIARRANERGAWIAPANTVLQDVVALEFDAASGALEGLYGAGANLIVREARGFTLMGSDTMSRDGSVRPLGVRRLLILIRKVALEEGAEMAFAPNDAALRRRIHRRFESIFSRLFARGAFAGSVPDEGFRIVTEEPVGIAANAERGRVVADLCVAPSRPLEFVKVRLVQTERGGLRLVDG